MKYRQKMFLPFAALSTIIIIIGFGIFCRYKIEQQRNEVYEILQSKSEQLTNKFDTAVEKMEFAASFVISDGDVLDGIKILARDQEIGRYDRDMAGAIRDIQSCLGAWYLTRNFHKVAVFNKYGFAITASGKLDTDFTKEILNRNRYEDVSGKKASLTKLHTSQWSKKDNTDVISLVKEIRGYSGSYIEVEYPVDLLEISDLNEKNFIIYDEDGKILISNIDEQSSYFDRLFISRESNGQEFRYGDKLIYTNRSEKSGITVMVLGDKGELDNKVLKMIFYYSIFILCILLVVLLYVKLSTNFLTKPILELVAFIEKTELENLGQPFTFSSNIKELQFLGNSFQRLLERLSHAIECEKKISRMNMQAQFDVLQAGVNPHFIFNVLNIIANRGMLLDDSKICSICSSLGSILRYSTNTKERVALVSQELKYLEHYFYLIKERFRDRFEYEYTIPDTIQNRKIPKLGLQQLAENSIQHGFTGPAASIKIVIEGWEDKDFWYISIQDDGAGFAEPVLAELNRKIVQAKEEFLGNGTELEIGGMGIINTYLRFYLIYGDQMDFLIKNMEKGAKVTIKVAYKE